MQQVVIMCYQEKFLHLVVAIGLVLLCGYGSAMAQESAATTPPATLPATAPSEPAIRTAEGGRMILNFKDASISAVLEQLSEVAGFAIVPEIKVEGRVTLLSKQAVTPDEAVALLNSVLKTNGYAAIQMGKILKIIPRDRAKKSSIPVRWGSDPEKIDPSDELITQVVPIRFADAVQLKQDLAALIGIEADLSANASSNSLILTDSAANVRRIVQIISILDTHLADSSEVKVFQLKYAGASAAARLINEVFRTDNVPGQQQAVPLPLQLLQRLGRGGGQPGGYQDLERSKVGASEGRKLMATDWPSSGLTVRLAEVRITGTLMKRLEVSLTVPETTTRSM